MEVSEKKKKKKKNRNGIYMNFSIKIKFFFENWLYYCIDFTTDFTTLLISSVIPNLGGESPLKKYAIVLETSNTNNLRGKILSTIIDKIFETNFRFDAK